MTRRSPLVVCAALALALAGLSGPAAQPARADGCGADSATLVNGDFETPVIAAGGNSSRDASQVPPWRTTDSANQIEIWSSGFGGVPSAQGAQFVEINANSAGTLYQDVVTTSGEQMTWTLEHRGRSGTDTMKVLIGNAATADVNGDTGWGYVSPDLTDPNTAWGAHTGSYTVPSGQACTRFGFRAVSSAGGDPSFGNFLDAADFQVSVPASPSPRPTLRPTPPATSTVGTDTPGPAGAPSSGPALLAALGLTAGGLLIARRRRARS